MSFVLGNITSANRAFAEAFFDQFSAEPAHLILVRIPPHLRLAAEILIKQILWEWEEGEFLRGRVDIPKRLPSFSGRWHDRKCVVENRKC